MSTLCSTAAEISSALIITLGLHSVRQLSEKQEEATWDIFTVAATHGGI